MAAITGKYIQRNNAISTEKMITFNYNNLLILQAVNGNARNKRRKIK